MDQTLLEMRARKWEAMGKPWFRGIAALPEVTEFQRAGVPTVLGKEYLKASRRAFWLTMGMSAMGGMSGIGFALLSGIFGAEGHISWNGLFLIYLVVFLLAVVVGLIMGRRPSGW